MNSSKTALLKMIHQHLPNLQESCLVPIPKSESHKHCMLCGLQNPLGLKINFYYTTDKQVWAQNKGMFHHQGYSNILHGGFIAALLDAAMCQALFKQNVEAVTADMNIRYLQEIAINSEILINAKITSYRPPLYKVEGQLFVDGQLMAKSSARFMNKGFIRPKSVQ